MVPEEEADHSPLCAAGLGHASADNLEHDVAVKEGAQNVSLLGLNRVDQDNWLD